MLFDVGDVQGMAEALIRVVTDAACSENLRRIGAENLTRFTPVIWTRRYGALLGQ